MSLKVVIKGCTRHYNLTGIDFIGMCFKNFELSKSDREEVSSVVKRATEGRKVTCEVTRKVIREVTRKVIREVTREVTRKVTREVTRKVIREVTRKVIREVTRKVIREVTRKVIREVTRKVTREVTRALVLRLKDKNYTNIWRLLILLKSLLERWLIFGEAQCVRQCVFFVIFLKVSGEIN